MLVFIKLQIIHCYKDDVFLPLVIRHCKVDFRPQNLLPYYIWMPKIQHKMAKEPTAMTHDPQ